MPRPEIVTSSRSGHPPKLANPIGDAKATADPQDQLPFRRVIFLGRGANRVCNRGGVDYTEISLCGVRQDS